ncbi:Ku protein [uncultured Streptomyces sp.]|uniref:non-homologous end joining protein Ku n=1 Tax=uncultured Streptomyces sp. TaxID=174707 RepID=UPI0026045E0D|nr:Ku protein [uncultured Streptomyces sp.]
MRSLWNGAISFGLVSIPVKLMNATENHGISFRQIHLTDGGRIRYRRVCEIDDEEVASAETGKAYEDVDGSMIPITDEDLASLPLHTAKTIEIVAFVPAEVIDPLQMEAAYYLCANGVPATKPYTLLREALNRSGKVALAKFALRGRERLGMLRVMGDVIAMHGLLWPDEIRSPEGVAPDGNVTVRDAELDLADALMNTLGDVDLDTLHDDFREAVEELVAAKAAGEAVPQPERPDEGGQVIDLLAALEKSVSAAKKERGGGGADGGAESERVADVHPIKGAGSRGSGGRSSSSPRSAASRTTPTGKRVPRSGTAAKKAEPKGGGVKKSPSTPAKATPAKSTAGKSTAAKSTAGKSTAAKTGAKKAGAKKATARKSAAGGRGPG